MFLSRLRRIIWPAELSRRVALVVLGVLLVGCLVNLSESPRPWKNGVGPRVAAGKNPMPKHYVATYNWYMAAANAALLTGLIVTIPLWVRRTAPLQGANGGNAAIVRPDAATWLLLAAAGTAFIYFAWPRMDHSLWGDEEFTFRRNLFGEFQREEPQNLDSPLVLERVPWLDTVYGFKRPNNHIFQTTLSRLSHEAWLATAWEQCRPQVGEAAVRLPSFLAALGTMGGLVALGALLGSPRVGGMAALLLALHPWFQRYGSEARGYALVMMFTVLGLVALILAMRSGRWRWWVLYGVTQFLMLWTFVGAVFVPLTLNLFVAGWLLVGRTRHVEWFVSNGARWVVVNLLSGMVFFQFMLPCLPMLRDHLEKGAGVPEEMGAVWWQDLGGHLLAGMDGPATWGPNTPWYQSWQALQGAQPIYFWLALLVTAGVALLGLATLALGRAALGNRATQLLLLAWAVVPIGIGLAHAQITQHYYYIWYFIFALPPYAFAWALGVEQLGAALIRLARLPEWAGTRLAMVLCLGLVVPAVIPRLQAQRTFPVEPLKLSAEFQRGPEACYPYQEGDVITAGFMMITPVYDPAFIKLENLADLEALITQARTKRKSLFVAFGARDLAALHFPQVMEELEESGRFQLVAGPFPATWPLLTRYVFQLKQPQPSSPEIAPLPAVAP